MTVAPNISSELTKAALKTFDFFQAERLTFALAESCTGGLCAAAFTEIPGVSSRFLCGYIVYSNEAKQRDLGVSKETLTRFGAVSSETVSEMLKGLRQKTGTCRDGFYRNGECMRRKDQSLFVSRRQGRNSPSGGVDVDSNVGGIKALDNSASFLYNHCVHSVNSSRKVIFIFKINQKSI